MKRIRAEVEITHRTSVAFEVDDDLDDEEIGVPGAITGTCTVSETTQEFVLMVARLFIRKNEVFEACCGT